jgi:LCP family protein required for cell wall assembly
MDGMSKRRLPVSRVAKSQNSAPQALPPPPAPPPLPDPVEEAVFEYRQPRRWQSSVWRWTKRAGIGLAALLVVAGAWFGFAALSAAHKIIVHSDGGAPALAGTLKPSQLKGEGDGRVNILVLGVGGQGHEGPNLSDTIMVWSLDPKTKDVAMLSVPRDLYVKIPGHGYSKINAANVYGGPRLAAQVVSNVIGVPIHYYAVIDFSGFRQAVNAVGGVDVSVTTALFDPKYPCDDGTRLAGRYCPIHFLPGVQHMDGASALKYSRSRETTSDFARAARQQQVLVALRQKALQLSTLTNPLKLTGLIEAVGDHLRTDLQLGDLQRLAQIAKDIDATKITQKVLDTGSADSLLVDGTGEISGAGSIELPKAGEFDYSQIHDFVKNIFVDHYITDENARVEVQNGTSVPGLAQKVVQSLQAAHYNVGAPVNAPATQATTVIYDYTNGTKPYTINYLERRFGVKALVVNAPPAQTDSSGNSLPAPEIRIIIGNDYQSNSSQN